MPQQNSHNNLFQYIPAPLVPPSDSLYSVAPPRLPLNKGVNPEPKL